MERTGEIEGFLDEQRVEHEIPGMSVAVFDADGVRHAAGLGARQIEPRSPATPDTRYSIASVTKTFTALALCQLAERGALELQDEIREYVEYWNDVPGDPITISEVMSHSHGMPSDYVGDRELLFADSPPPSPVITREDYIRHVNAAADRRIEDPQKYMYSGFGYLILGEIIEAVVDRTYAEYVTEEIFHPLGMERSQVGYGELADIGDDTIMGYRLEDGEPVPNSHDLEAELRAPYSGGGILSSMIDLAKVGQCLLNGGTLEGTQVLDSSFVDAMCSHQAPTWETIDGREIGYGYGLQITDLLGERLAQHTGTAPGISRAYLGILPESGLGATVGVNQTDVPIGVIGRGVLALLLDEEPYDSVPTLALEEKISDVTGSYEDPYGTTRITVEDAGTHIEVNYVEGLDREFPAFPKTTARDDYRFYSILPGGTYEPVTFQETDDGMEIRCSIDRLTRTV